MRVLRGALSPFVWTRLAWVLVLVTGAAVLTGVAPAVLRVVVDRMVGGTNGSALHHFLALYVLALWLARILNEIRGFVFAQVRQRISRALSERLFAHVMHLPLQFHLIRRTGAIGGVLDSGLEGLGMILHHMVFTYLPVVVELITIFVVLARMVPPEFLGLFFVALACYIAVFGRSAATIAGSARRASAARIEGSAVITDGLLNYETVKYFTAEALAQVRVCNALRRVEDEWIIFYRQYALNGITVAGVFALFLCAAAFYSADQVGQKHMTIGVFVLVNAYMLQIVRPVEMLGYATQGVLRGVAMLDGMLQLFRETRESGTEGASCGLVGAGSLEFHDVCVSCKSGRVLLTNVSFRIDAGLTLGVVGPSGAGKSTLVRLLMRLLEPNSGMILLDDVPISSLALEALRRAIAVVPQETALFDDTVRYNIGLGRPGASLEEIEEAAKVARLHDFVMRLPDGYDTRVGERGVRLSGGERQRISIARAVLRSPRIYVFDEATSSLDSQTERDIVCSVRAVSRAHTTVIIAHRLSTVVHADEIVVLEQGRIAERGRHEELLGFNGRYSELWRAQQDGAVAA